MANFIVDELPRSKDECPILQLGLECPYFQEKEWNEAQEEPYSNTEAICPCAWGHIEAPRNYCPFLIVQKDSND